MAWALITGGTSGIGAGFARELAARGFDLVLVARTRERLDSVAAELRDASPVEVEVISADLSDRAEVLRVAERLSDTARPIELFVNNAGFGVGTALTAIDTTPHEQAMDVMCRAVLILGGAAGRTMRERGTGAILNVASIAGLLTMGSYSAIKAWVIAYSQSLATELRGSGVTVTALLPGWVDTEFHERMGGRTSSVPAALWVDMDVLVRTALRDLDRRRPVSIPTLRYRTLGWWARHLPRRTVQWLSARVAS